MSDLGDLLSSRLLHAFETWAAVEAMRKLAVKNPHIPWGHPSPAPTTRQRQPHPTPAPVPDRHIHFQAPLTQSTRGTSLPAQQLVNPAMALLPIQHQSTPPVTTKLGPMIQVGLKSVALSPMDYETKRGDKGPRSMM
ncbi:hypothetical protein RhiTH_011485 [Rhizoctonia solani]